MAEKPPPYELISIDSILHISLILERMLESACRLGGLGKSCPSAII